MSALALTLRPLRHWLADTEVTELCINRPGEAFIESRSGWIRASLEFADFDWCMRLAKLVAHFGAQRIDEQAPLLSATLPDGERVQIAIPPATTVGTVSITIRRPSSRRWSVEDLALRGVFRSTRRAGVFLDAVDERLLDRLAAHDYTGFMRFAVASRKNILVSGPTGSGKTTWTQALIREIPASERLITIEDARELELDRHPNHVRLFYSKDDQGLSRVTAKQLLECCLRMRPDRVLLAELRSEEAFDYLRNINSGHPGSITSVHAASAELAFEQLVLLVKQSRAGADLARSDIKALLYMLVDIVVQFSVERYERFVKEIWYEPHRKLGMRAEDGSLDGVRRSRG